MSNRISRSTQGLTQSLLQFKLYYYKNSIIVLLGALREKDREKEGGGEGERERERVWQKPKRRKVTSDFILTKKKIQVRPLEKSQDLVRIFYMLSRCTHGTMVNILWPFISLLVDRAIMKIYMRRRGSKPLKVEIERLSS